MTIKRFATPILIGLLCLGVLLAPGCAHKSTVATPGAPAAAPVSVTARILQYNQIVSTANQNAATVVTSLVTGGAITPAQGQAIATYEAAIAKVTTGVAQTLQQNIPWADKVIQLQNLALSLVPPSGYRTFGATNDTQWQALIAALDGIESTLKIMVTMAQASPAGS